MNFTKVVMALLIFPPITTFASNCGALRQDIDSALQQCKQSAQNSIDTANCYKKATTEWDSELNNQYKLLMADQDDTTKSQLKLAQREWIKYKELYFKSIDLYYQQQTGSIWESVNLESKMNVIKDKAVDLYRLRESTDLS